MYVSVSKGKPSRFLSTPKSWIVQITLEFPLRTCQKHHSITLFLPSHIPDVHINCYINYLINFSSFEILYNLRLDLNNKKIKLSGGKRFSTINVPSFSYILC